MEGIELDVSIQSFAPWRFALTVTTTEKSSADGRFGLVIIRKNVSRLDRVLSWVSTPMHAQHAIIVSFDGNMLGELGWLDERGTEDASERLLGLYAAEDHEAIINWLRSSAMRRAKSGTCFVY